MPRIEPGLRAELPDVMIQAGLSSWGAISTGNIPAAAAVGDAWAGEVASEGWEGVGVRAFGPGEDQGWAVSGGVAVPGVWVPEMRVHTSCSQCRVANVAAPTVKAITVVSVRL